MNKYQRTNQFPSCTEFGVKDKLWKNLKKQKAKFPEEYYFLPKSYVLPDEFDLFTKERKADGFSKMYIKKPANDAAGKGIKVIGRTHEVENEKGYLISEYVENPHLINGKKYDLRIYVLIRSFEPLRIYLYREGLVRFCTHDYSTDESKITDRFMHLTNYAVNKQSEDFVNAG